MRAVRRHGRRHGHGHRFALILLTTPLLELALCVVVGDLQQEVLKPASVAVIRWWRHRDDDCTGGVRFRVDGCSCVSRTLRTSQVSEGIPNDDDQQDI